MTIKHEDIIISPMGPRYSVDVVAGPHLGTADDRLAAEATALDYMDQTGLYPNLWHVDDYDGADLVVYW